MTNDTFIAIDSSSNTPVDFRINYLANGDIVLSKVETAPTVATPASSSPPGPINSDTVNLSVLGADSDTGESSLESYTWVNDGKRCAFAPVNFKRYNGTNAAKNTTATFTAPGLYHFLVTITDPDGLTATSAVDVTVNPANAKVTSVLAGATSVDTGVILTAPISTIDVSFSADLDSTSPVIRNSVTNPANCGNCSETASR